MKLAVFGAGGRMGQTLVRAIAGHDDVELKGAIEPEGSPFLGQDAGHIAQIGETGVIITDDTLAVLRQVDGIIDFTVPAATVALSKMAAEAKVAHIIGTTGCRLEEDEAIRAAGQSTRVLKSGNMSLGVNLLAAMAKQVAASLDESFDIEIVEMHHRHKVDAPSGTALLLAEAAAEGRGVDLAERSVRSRDGITGARNEGDIGFATLRGGSVIGEHSVIFAGASERIELVHKAEDRGIFANGAVKAALWLHHQPLGFYTMLDMLGLSQSRAH